MPNQPGENQAEGVHPVVEDDFWGESDKEEGTGELAREWDSRRERFYNVRFIAKKLLFETGQLRGTMDGTCQSRVAGSESDMQGSQARNMSSDLRCGV
jgi:hypothetical protein